MWKHAAALDENDLPLERSRREKFAKKHLKAVAELDSRLAMLLRMLNTGINLRQALSMNWIHPEQAGVFAICTNSPPLRLYFLPLPDRQLILTLTIGAKNRQSEDVKMVADWAREILNG